MYKRLTAITGAILVAAVAATLTAKKAPDLSASQQPPRRQAGAQTDELTHRQKLLEEEMALVKTAHYFSLPPRQQQVIEAEIIKRQTAVTEEQVRLQREAGLPPVILSNNTFRHMTFTYKGIKYMELVSVGTSSMSSMSTGSLGYTVHPDVSWKIFGMVWVHVLDAAGKEVFPDDKRPAPTPQERRRWAAIMPNEPLLELTANGKTHVEHGFGRHDIRDEHGTLLLSFLVDPLASK